MGEEEFGILTVTAILYQAVTYLGIVLQPCVESVVNIAACGVLRNTGVMYSAV